MSRIQRSMDTRDTLKQYICAELLNDLDDLDDSENLLSDGMVDSLGMVRLLGFIEDELNVSVPPEDFTIDNFRTVADIATYLDARMEA
ncbi:MAG: acyl carrier protein [Phycisphaeraceae bacterium]|nr:acyl carrier protein [Phycisphaeraceae bacterium]